VKWNLLREKEDIAKGSYKVEDEEGVEVAETNGIESQRGDLTDDQTKTPVHECGERVPTRADLNWKDFGLYKRNLADV
jgi:hypothetical protein